jgi:hypothetical protein
MAKVEYVIVLSLFQLFYLLKKVVSEGETVVKF